MSSDILTGGPTTSKPAHTDPIWRQQVIDATHIKSRGNVFALGPFPKRINFASQQLRAFNLAWALTDAGVVQPGDRVAVVGAGLAGLTMAAALSRKQVNVEVYEREAEPLKLQRFTTSRYVHPTLNYWPEIALTPTTSFPFLNWCSDLCATVLDTVQAEWDEHFAHISVSTGQAVSELEGEGAALKLNLAKGGIRGPFKAVVLAVGFGLEEATPGSLLPSYWDDLDPRRGLSSTSQPLLISGIGDGGILETLRLVYGKSFQQGQLTAKVARQVLSLGLEGELRDIETSASAKTGKTAGAELRQRYCGDFPSELTGYLDDKLAGGLKVSLAAKQASAFALTSAPVHRLMLGRAIQKERVDVLVGSVKVTASGAEFVPSAITATPVALAAGSFILRHGPVGEFKTLIDPLAMDELKVKQAPLTEYQYKMFWPFGYFDADPISPGSQEDQTIMKSHYARVKASFAKEHPEVDHISVALREGDLVYRLACKPEDAVDVKTLPATLLGRPTDIKVQDAFVGYSGAVAAYRSMTPGPPRPLRVGDRLRASPSRTKATVSRAGVVTCFVERSNAEPMALTAGHVFRGGAGTEVYASAPDGDNWTYVGTLCQRPKSHDDVAAIELAPQTAFDVGEDGTFNTLASSLSLLGRTVFRCRADGTRVQGCITELAQGVPLETDGEVDTLQEALVVRGDMTGFANPGDSGSLVRLDTNEVVGMVVGGNSESTLIAPIARALEEIGGRLAQVSGGGKPIIAEPAAALALSSADDHRELKARPGQGTFASIDVAPELYRYRDTLATALADLSIIPASGVRAPRLFYVPRFIQWMRHHARDSIDTAWGRTIPLQIDGSPDRAALGSKVPVSFQDLDRVIHGRPVALVPAVISGFALSQSGLNPDAPSVPDWILPIEDGSRTSWGVKSHIERHVVHADILSEIIPAIYVIEGVDQSSEPSWKHDLRNVDEADVFDDGNARHWAALVVEMQQGRFVTSQTAHVVRSLLVRMGYEVGRVKMADPYALRHGRAAYNERVVRKYMFPK